MSCRENFEKKHVPVENLECIGGRKLYLQWFPAVEIILFGPKVRKKGRTSAREPSRQAADACHPTSKSVAQEGTRQPKKSREKENHDENKKSLNTILLQKHCTESTRHAVARGNWSKETIRASTIDKFSNTSSKQETQSSLRNHGRKQKQLHRELLLLCLFTVFCMLSASLGIMSAQV